MLPVSSCWAEAPHRCAVLPYLVFKWHPSDILCLPSADVAVGLSLENAGDWWLMGRHNKGLAGM